MSSYEEAIKVRDKVLKEQHEYLKGTKAREIVAYVSRRLADLHNYDVIALLVHDPDILFGPSIRHEVIDGVEVDFEPIKRVKYV